MQRGARGHQRTGLGGANLLDKAFAFAFRGLVYAQIWDDPVVDMAGLALNADSRVVTIARLCVAAHDGMFDDRGCCIRHGLALSSLGLTDQPCRSEVTRPLR